MPLPPESPQTEALVPLAQVPQAPPPADPHGPQAAPQQNHEASP